MVGPRLLLHLEPVSGNVLRVTQCQVKSTPRCDVILTHDRRRASKADHARGRSRTVDAAEYTVRSSLVTDTLYSITL